MLGSSPVTQSFSGTRWAGRSGLRRFWASRCPRATTTIATDWAVCHLSFNPVRVHGIHWGGLIATYQALAYEVDAQLSYKANRQANRFRFGDEFRFDTSLQVRVWPRELGDGVPGF